MRSVHCLLVVLCGAAIAIVACTAISGVDDLRVAYDGATADGRSSSDAFEYADATASDGSKTRDDSGALGWFCAPLAVNINVTCYDVCSYVPASCGSADGLDGIYKDLSTCMAAEGGHSPGVLVPCDIATGSSYAGFFIRCYCGP